MSISAFGHLTSMSQHLNTLNVSYEIITANPRQSHDYVLSYAQFILPGFIYQHLFYRSGGGAFFFFSLYGECICIIIYLTVLLDSFSTVVLVDSVVNMLFYCSCLILYNLITATHLRSLTFFFLAFHPVQILTKIVILFPHTPFKLF